MAGCKACQKKKEKKKKRHSSKDSPRKEKKEKKEKKKLGIQCSCCSECLCYKYGGKEDWYCKCGCGNCKCGIKVLKHLQKGKK